MNQKYTTFLLILFLSFGTFVFGQKEIVILHTNDSHSRIEPVPETDKTHPDKGGVIRRMNFVEQMRKEKENVLLLDAGDFLQGTPYFNLFKGEVEIEAMNLLGYNAATLGNHEFDYGMEVLENVVRKADFPILSSNYDFSDTPLHGLIHPYTIVNKDGLRIGILALGINPKGLIATDNYKGMKFLAPLETANNIAAQLKNQKKCDFVICLSHLGYEADMRLAPQTKNIDIIIGGHSHWHMEKPSVVKNIDNKDVTIFQTAGRGVVVGQINVELEKVKK